VTARPKRPRQTTCSSCARPGKTHCASAGCPWRQCRNCAVQWSVRSGERMPLAIVDRKVAPPADPLPDIK